MKINSKAFILIAINFIFFIILAMAFPIIRFSATAFILTSTVFTLSIFGCLYFFMTKRIRQLTQQAAKIDFKTKLLQSMDIQGSDEVAAIADQINRLILTMHAMHFEAQQHAKKHIDVLEKSNTELKQEILEQKAADKKLAIKENTTQLAHYDTLTTLPNRIFFNEILNKTLNHSKRHNKIIALLAINLDAFKKINTMFGNSVGDQVLKEIGARLANTLRTEDILAKLDGDEFIVLLNDISKPKFASAVAKKILHVCAEPIKINSQEISVTASIGISIYPNDGASLEDLLENLTTALYKAKRAGGNDYQFFSPTMDLEAHEYIRLDNELRKAILNNELTLYYQPKLHLKRGSIIGVEALLRWPHAEFGFISPDKFLPLAEESGLIMQLGEWVLLEACKMNKYWQTEGYQHLTVAVNLSPKQFYHPDIAKIISTTLEKSGLNPSYLELEINEKTIMDNIDLASNVLEKIKSLGVRLSIDHFGTGYTSISHLKQLPVSSLKIDRGFIKGIPNNPNDLSIVSAFIGLAHNLGLEVIAEGIESAEQVQYLETQNCDIIQGYFLSHPLPAQKIVLQFKKLMDTVLL